MHRIEPSRLLKRPARILDRTSTADGLPARLTALINELGEEKLGLAHFVTDISSCQLRQLSLIGNQRPTLHAG